MSTTALVTGASRGIGRAIALALASDGHQVVINYLNDAAAAKATCDEISSRGGQAISSRFDVADADATRSALDRLSELLDEPISILVNNAGVASDKPFPKMSSEDWDRVINTTLRGFYNVTRTLVMPMVKKRWGRIINISSLSGLMGNRGQVNYAAAKAGLIGATKALAKEVAKRGVTVNAVAPGLIATDMTTRLPAEITEAIPLRRLGTAKEVAELVAFLASSKADYITGQVIGIDGGLG